MGGILGSLTIATVGAVLGGLLVPRIERAWKALRQASAFVSDAVTYAHRDHWSRSFISGTFTMLALTVGVLMTPGVMPFVVMWLLGAAIIRGFEPTIAQTLTKRVPPPLDSILKLNERAHTQTGTRRSS